MANRSIKSKNLSFFEKYLTVFVFACIILGILLGRSVPELALTLDSYTVFNVSIPIAIALFFMVYPIMVKIDFGQILKAAKTPRPVGLTLFLNWVVAPFSTFLIAWFFFGIPVCGFFTRYRNHSHRPANRTLAQLPGRGNHSGNSTLHRHGFDVELPGPG